MQAMRAAAGGGAGAGAGARLGCGARAGTSTSSSRRIATASASSPSAGAAAAPMLRPPIKTCWSPRPAKSPRRAPSSHLAAAVGGGGSGASGSDGAADAPHPSTATNSDFHGALNAPKPPGAPVDPQTGLAIHPQQPEGWWEGRITRDSAKGPPGDVAPWGGLPPPRNRDEGGRLGMGGENWARFQNRRRIERQRAWEALRREAARRWEAAGGSALGAAAAPRGSSLPPWFRPEMLDRVIEHPSNTFLRQIGYSDYQVPAERAEWIAQGRAHFAEQDARAAAAADAAADRALEEGEAAAATDDSGGGGGGEDGGGKGGNDGGGAGGWFWRRWWREDDPYWPLRDWGDHPARWWTVAFGLFFLAGALTAPLQGGDAFAGYLAAAALLSCGAMLSDMRHDWVGHMGVKLTWIACALIAAWEYACGWRLGPFWRFPWAAERPSPLPALLKFAFGLETHELPRWLGGAPASPPPPAGVRGVPASARGVALDSGCDADHFPDTSRLPLGHRPTQFSLFSPGGAALFLAALCMATDMGGLSGEGTAIQENPGGVFKVDNVVRKNRAWEYWGYASVPMGMLR